MKKIVTGSIFILALMLSNLTFAQSNAATTAAHSEQEWISVGTQKNVEISFSKINVNGTFYLAIELENKSEKETPFTWSLFKSNTLLYSGVSKVLKSGSTITLFDATQQVVIGEHESYDAYSVEIR